MSPGTTKRAKTADNEGKIQKALKALLMDKDLTLADAARQYKVDYHTLSHRAKGGKSRSEGKENQQLLSTAEEQELVRWIQLLTATRHPA